MSGAREERWRSVEDPYALVGGFSSGCAVAGFVRRRAIVARPGEGRALGVRRHCDRGWRGCFGLGLGGRCAGGEPVCAVSLMLTWKGERANAQNEVRLTASGGTSMKRSGGAVKMGLRWGGMMSRSQRKYCDGEKRRLSRIHATFLAIDQIISVTRGQSENRLHRWDGGTQGADRVAPLARGRI